MMKRDNDIEEIAQALKSVKDIETLTRYIEELKISDDRKIIVKQILEKLKNLKENTHEQRASTGRT